MITDKVKALLADRGYDVGAIRAEIVFQDIQAVIPAKRGRNHFALHNRCKCRPRSRTEQMFGKLKNWRHIATLYDKARLSYLGFVSLISTLLWLPLVHMD